MPQYTTRYRIQSPTLTEGPRVAGIAAMASSVDTALGVVEDALRTLVASTAGGIQNQINSLSDRVADARGIRRGVVGGSSGTTTVVTGQLGIDGCVVNVPANVRCVVTVSYDVVCTIRNDACTFEGRVRILDEGSSTPRDVPGQATFTPSAAGQGGSFSRSWEFGASATPYRIQANVRKSSNNANFTVTNTNTVMDWEFLRTGILP